MIAKISLTILIVWFCTSWVIVGHWPDRMDAPRWASRFVLWGMTVILFCVPVVILWAIWS